MLAVPLPTVEVNPPTTPKAVVIWLQGLGADGHDFESIIPELRLPADLPVRFVFPHAPREEHFFRNHFERQRRNLHRIEPHCVQTRNQRRIIAKT